MNYNLKYNNPVLEDSTFGVNFPLFHYYYEQIVIKTKHNYSFNE